MKKLYKYILIALFLPLPVSIFCQMELEYDTDLLLSSTIEIHLSDTVDVLLDWGYGFSIPIKQPGIYTHTYQQNGTYIVKISGKLTWFGSDQANYTNRALVRVNSFGNLGLRSLKNAFKYARNIVYVPPDLPETVNNLSGCFSYIYDQSYVENIEVWDVTNIIDMSYLFYFASVFNQDITGWDVSNVIDMSYMFYLARSFNQDISSWNVNQVTDMRHMFSSAKKFNQDIGNWDVTNVTNMREMFLSASLFNQDISGWCVEKMLTSPFSFSTQCPLLEEYLPHWGETCNPVHIAESNNLSNILIFPNPATDRITIQGDYIEVRIYNQIGNQVLYYGSGSEIDVSDLEIGLYILEIKTDRVNVRRKLIIK